MIAGGHEADGRDAQRPGSDGATGEDVEPSFAAASAMIGMPSRNEKRAASSRRRPQSRPLAMVDPERDRPGSDREPLQHGRRARVFGQVSSCAASVRGTRAADELAPRP